jgi:catechol 2,3-dioxygenase-like lactoylglutathione lyase family enzyme
MVLLPTVSENLFTQHFSILDVAHVPQYAPLIVEDLERVFLFYRDLLGLEVVSGDESGQYAEFRLGAGTLALAEAGALSIVAQNTSLLLTPELRGEQTLLFGVKDVQAVRGRLSAAGVAVKRGDQEWITAFRDPDGNQVCIMPN